jgi:hypothetical protein
VSAHGWLLLLLVWVVWLVGYVTGLATAAMFEVRRENARRRLYSRFVNDNEHHEAER